MFLRLLFLFLLNAFVSNDSFCQKESLLTGGYSTLEEFIEKNFNYDTLKTVNCEEVPPGIY